ncbi:MAG TPA: ribonuclease P [Thermoplasmatales archaeon]|nr:ribonuclease P [Thermoplasmatales archaeon]
MVRRRRLKEKVMQKKIARQRINILFHLAEDAAKKHRFDRADRYVQLARKIGMKYLIPIPREFKHLMCKKCHRFLLPGVTGRVRVSRGKIVISCLYCKHCKRIPLREKTFRYP